MTNRWCISGAAFVGLLASALFAQQPNQPPEQPRQAQPGQGQSQNGQQLIDRERPTAGIQRSDERQDSKAKSAIELQSMVNQLTIQIPDAIRTAERQTPDAKVCVVEVCEWKNVQPGLTRTLSEPQTRGEHPGQPRQTAEQPKDHPVQPKQPGAAAGETLDTRSQPLETRGQPLNRDMTGMSSGHPVVRVVCVGNNRLTEVVVCGKTGQVLGTREHTTFARTGPTSAGPMLTTSIERTAPIYGYERTVLSPAGSTERASGGTVEVTAQTSTGRDVNSPTIVSQMEQPVRPGQTTYEESWRRPAQRWQKVADIRGKDVVVSSGGEDIGDVKELVIDPDTGRSLYYVIEFKDRKNLGNKWYAFPVSVCRLSDDADDVILMVQTTQIQPASGFDEKAWPNMTDPQWGTQAHTAYGQRPYWERSGAADRTIRSEHENAADATAIWSAPKRWQRASDLIGKSVRNRQDEELGNVRDIVIDPDSGRILYGVLSFGGFLGLGDKLFAIPWTAMDLAGDHKSFFLNIDKSQLRQAQGFDKSNWPNMADERWATSVHQQYEQPRYWDPSETARRDGRNP